MTQFDMQGNMNIHHRLEDETTLDINSFHYLREDETIVGVPLGPGPSISRRVKRDGSDVEEEIRMDTLILILESGETIALILSSRAFSGCRNFIAAWAKHDATACKLKIRRHKMYEGPGSDRTWLRIERIHEQAERAAAE